MLKFDTPMLLHLPATSCTIEPKSSFQANFLTRLQQLLHIRPSLVYRGGFLGLEFPSCEEVNRTQLATLAYFENLI